MKRTTPFIRAALTIAAKDLRAELRSRQLISAMALFAILATITFYYAFQDHHDVQVIALPGVLWVITVFAGTLGIGRSLAQEHDRGSLDGLLLAPIDRAAMFCGKLISTWLFTLIVGALVSFADSILFNTPIDLISWVLVLIFGTLGFSTIGTFLGSMAVHGRGRETTLPILILPVALPLIIAAINNDAAILNGDVNLFQSVWFLTIVSIDIFFVGASLLLFEYIVEE